MFLFFPFPFLSFQASRAQLAADPRFSQSSTLLIFDWDDTLFPSSWVMKEAGFEGTNVPPGAEIRQRLSTEAKERHRKVEKLSKKTLQTAAKLGLVRIVSSASIGWISDAARELMPDLAQLLDDSGLFREGIKACASKYQRQEREEWKNWAFEECLTEWQSLDADSTEDSWNLLSIGDAQEEKDAAFHLSTILEKRGVTHVVKTVKLERCGARRLTKQLKYLEETLSSLVSCPRSVNVVCSFCKQTGNLLVNTDGALAQNDVEADLTRQAPEFVDSTDPQRNADCQGADTRGAVQAQMPQPNPELARRPVQRDLVHTDSVHEKVVATCV
uniref:Swiss Army Knife RNA repair protein HAD domain-containing protein n=1 Tax=Chromera velia CCMP2878 TaxID=1169474 RepID=A0A0K6SBE6_9ALVE|eukprot:Cvel_14127.t1-p1 / transcript=Cvel_14127.t1 / gene=Cvel_14127 / organism=Chromera_velia_CCMP2878 / gene_product=hypothetical protein / transcript_product=hypothetical protein / location=Cvel_scaffold995:18865-22351(-) / protein_length=328 / sequence_SO=supercontig / SO=protein_coding / is_pseudo=false